MYLLPLRGLLKTAQVGGKAAGLSQLIEYGVAVPPGFAVTKDLLEVYTKTGAFPELFEVNVKTVLTELKSEQVIVRSSAVGEDSESHSFAGQLDSFVVENDCEAVKTAILKCWDSLKNDRVATYQNISGKRLTEMGVVIQEFLDADYAGVTFTKSPYDEDSIYTEYVKGAGEKLVSGKVTPENFSVKLVEGVVPELPFTGKELIEKSVYLQKRYGCPLDIEWVSKGGEIYFVQARPITVKNHSKVHWTNTNLNENYPDPISPLLYSVARDSYYHYFKNLSGLLQIDPVTIRRLEYDFSNTVGIWGNRIYYNMTSIHNILSSSPLKSYFKDAFNKFVGYSDKDVADSDTSERTSLFRLVKRLVGLNFKLESHVRQIEKMVSEYSERVEQAKEYRDYKDLFYEFLDLRFNQWYHASLADFFSMIHYKALGKFTQKFYGEQSVGVHNLLIQAIPGLMSSEPLNDTFDIAEEINKDELLRKFFLENSSVDVYREISENEDWKSIKNQIQSYLKKWGIQVLRRTYVF